MPFTLEELRMIGAGVMESDVYPTQDLLVEFKKFFSHAADLRNGSEPALLRLFLSLKDVMNVVKALPLKRRQELNLD